MKKKVRIVLIILAVLVIIVGLLSCGEDYEEESYDEYTEDTEQYEDGGYEEEISENETEDSTESAYSQIDLDSDGQFPFGTCRKLEGKTVVVTLFVNDLSTSWDLQNNQQDIEMYRNMVTRTRIGYDWIEEQAKAYGKDVEIISDFEADPDLFYQVDLEADFTDNAYHIDVVKPFLGENMHDLGAKLMERYGADNIHFAIYINSPQNTEMVSYAYPYLGEMMDLPYECAVYSAYVYGAEQGPAMYAHEFLHTFGAPDVYMANNSINPINITQEFVDYCTENHRNEIMYSNYDISDNSVNFNMVTNELTDLTAYYLGWIDYNQECEQFGVDVREDK